MLPRREQLLLVAAPALATARPRGCFHRDSRRAPPPEGHHQRPTPHSYHLHCQRANRILLHRRAPRRKSTRSRDCRGRKSALTVSQKGLHERLGRVGGGTDRVALAFSLTNRIGSGVHQKFTSQSCLMQTHASTIVRYVVLEVNSHPDQTVTPHLINTRQSTPCRGSRFWLVIRSMMLRGDLRFLEPRNTFSMS